MLHPNKLVLWLFSAIILSCVSASADTKKNSIFTLDRAILQALEHSPRLAAFGSGVAAAKGDLLQSGAWSNPELGVQVENMGGKGKYQGFESLETTYGITQELQIGGKISARKNIARKGLEIAHLDYQAAALDLIRDVTIAYAEAIAAEEYAHLALQQKELAQDVLKSVSERVEAAAAPLIQKSRADVELATATLSLHTATRDSNIARKNLSLLIGTSSSIPKLDRNMLYGATKIKIPNSEGDLTSNPDLAKLDSNLEQSKAKLDLEKANAIPDPRVNVGMRHFNESGDHAVVVGLSIPIPIFNANNGNIEKARSEVNRTQFESRQTMLTMNTDLARSKLQMQEVGQRLGTLKRDILPAAGKAFQLSREGYGAGRFSYMEVLDAQRSLFNARQQYIATLKELHVTKAQIERLSALHLNKILSKGATHAE